MKSQSSGGRKAERMGRRAVIKAGAKVIPALAVMGLAVTTSAPARADCFPASCRAECADSCNNNCRGDCMGSCERVNL